MRDQWDELLPDPFGDEKLQEWSPWNRGEPLGNSKASGYMRERLDQAFDGVPPESVNLTDLVLAQIRLDRHDYWKVVKRYYLGNQSCIEISGEWGRTEGFVRRLLQELTRRVARDWHRAKKYQKNPIDTLA